LPPSPGYDKEGLAAFFSCPHRFLLMGASPCCNSAALPVRKNEGIFQSKPKNFKKINHEKGLL